MLCVQAAGGERRGDHVHQLSSLLGVYNELIALRRLSVALRRRCGFLESVQSLLRSQNSMLMTAVAERTQQTPPAERRRHAGGGPSKRPASSKQPAERNAPSADAPNGHRPLQYQGSGGLGGNSRHVVGTDAAAAASERQQVRYLVYSTGYRWLLPPYLKYVATLPCKISMFKKSQCSRSN